MVLLPVKRMVEHTLSATIVGERVDAAKAAAG